jgi:hypothetical protein
VNKRLWLLLVPAALAAAGCSAPPKPLRFNNMMARANAKLSAAAKSFGKTLEPLANGRPADPGAVRSAYRNMESALKEVKAEFDELKPPLNSGNGQEMLDKYKEFLRGQENVLSSVASRVVQIVETPMAPGQQWAQIQPLLAQAPAIESQTLTALKGVQDKYAQSHKLKLGR